MTAKVKLDVIDGPMKGKDFVFEEHDTFIFGRSPECQACIPNDPLASRRHFIMEANPPDAFISDLGSLNGTYVNGTKHGSRAPGEDPEAGAKRKYPQVQLNNGDRVKVGETIFAVKLEAAGVCCECDCDIADADKDKCAWIGGTYICPKCKSKLASMGTPAKKPEPVRCQKCGKEVAAEIGKERRGDYVCKACRKKAVEDPLELLMELVGAGMGKPDAGAPAIRGYDIGKRLGIGGFGAVYLGQRKKDGLPVAVKVMLAKVAVNENSRKRFMREIELIKDLRHAHIVPFVDSGSAGGAFYFIMDFCPGGDVTDLMKARGGKLPVSEAGPIILQALEGLAYIHGKNEVHRDLKPQNILLMKTEAPWDAKITDLGLGKCFDKHGLSGTTVTGSYAGTPVFMPREQVVNFKSVTPVGDIWSMGATLYNMLTGGNPRDFPRGKDPLDIILNGEIVPVRRRNSDIPRGLAEVVDRSVAKMAKDRYQTAEEMRKALNSAL
jgi:eukaryotic-like serine/threonine-protein kinase